MRSDADADADAGSSVRRVREVDPTNQVIQTIDRLGKKTGEIDYDPKGGKLVLSYVRQLKHY